MGKSKKSGTKSKNPTSMHEEDEDNFLKIHRDCQWLQNRQEELSVSLNYEALKEHMETSDETEEVVQKLMKAMEILNLHLDKASIATVKVTSLQLADTIYKSAIGDIDNEENGDPQARNIQAPIQNEIQQLLKEMALVSREISSENEKTRQMEREISRAEDEITALSTKRSYLTKKIEDKKEWEKFQKEGTTKDAYERITQKTKSVSNLVTIWNYILPLLICYSSLNWDEDKDLLNTVLECGMPLEEQLELVSISPE